MRLRYGVGRQVIRDVMSLLDLAHFSALFIERTRESGKVSSFL